MNCILFVPFCILLSTASILAQNQPNIVFLLADDLGYMDVGFNNPDTFYETPNLDGLAKSGMVLQTSMQPLRCALRLGRVF